MTARSQHVFTRPAVLHAAVLCLLMGMAAAPIAQAQTAPPAPTHRHDIPAGSLEDALNRFARTSGILLSFDPAVTQGRRSVGLSGVHGVADGFAALLAGSGLQATLKPDGGYAISPAPVRSDAAPGAPHSLPEIRISGRAPSEQAMGPINGRIATRSVTGIKTDTALVDVPQSISVIGREELNARGAQSVMEALRYTPGVAVDSYGVDTRGSEWALMRGFDSNATGNIKNGLPQTTSAWISFQTEVHGLERIEVLRGPASVAYGQIEAGGTIHRISKRPQAKAVREVEVQTGSYGRAQIAADVGGSLNEDGSVLYRLVGLGLDTDKQLRFANGQRASNERLYLAPSLSWRPTTSTSITLLADYQKDINKGFSLYVAQNGRSTGLLGGDPSFLRYALEQASLGYALEHRMNEQWSLRQNFRHAQAILDNRFLRPIGVTGRLFERSANHVRDEVHQSVLDTNVQGQFNTGPVAHVLLVGLDWNKVSSDDTEDWPVTGSTPPLDLDNPVYGVAFPIANVPRFNRSRDLRQLGLYVQDQLTIEERWIVTLGLRDDVARAKTNNHLNRSFQAQRDHATTGRVGLNHKITPDLAPYISYAESFMPQIKRSSNGEPYKPTQGKQVEVGMKYQPVGSQTLFTAALFELTKTNVESYDAATFIPRQVGEVRSRGLEMEARARIASRLDLQATYTWNDVEVTRSIDTDLGKRPIQVPRQMASVGLDYALPFGLSLGAGVRHVGRRFDDAANTTSTASFTLADAGVRYAIGDWNLALNVNNLFNRRYVASRAYEGFYPGEERNWLATVKYRF